MTAETIPHSAPLARNEELRAWTARLYALISSGHDRLEFNVDARGPALTAIGADGKRWPIQVGSSGDGSVPPPWQRARELRAGGEIVPRRFNSFVLERHVAGKYSVAPAAAGWVQWVALDIDAHRRSGESALEARRRALGVLGTVWRVLNCSAERHPIVLRSPGGGFHVWFPLTRGPGSVNPEHTWPARAVRGWFERHLTEAGLELAPGTLEVFPSGRCLRAPCGVGTVLLQATQSDEPDGLGLVPWPDTMRNERVDWRGEREALSSPVRRVVPTIRAFVAQWEAQRRTLAEWLGRPEASWDPAWGPLGWRTDAAEIAPEAEKNSGGISSPQDSRSQESDDLSLRFQAEPSRVRAQGSGRSRLRRGRPGSGPIPDPWNPLIAPPAPEVDAPRASGGAHLVRGRAFRTKVERLLGQGITEPSTRHDAVLTLTFYWAATCGLGMEPTLARLMRWCQGHGHTGSRLGARPRVFLAACLREARHYIEHYAALWPFRGRGDGGGLASLTTADHAVLAAVDPRVRGEVSAILAWLAGRADGAGRIGEPVQIATGLLARLCGDRRLEEEGQRRRSTTIAIAELERLGVLTLAGDYRVGHRGRLWSCWYQFGSGTLPRAIDLPAATWAELESPSRGIALEAVPAAPASAASSAPAGPDAPAPTRPMVTVRVVGERAVPEGLLRVLSDGARGVPRTLLTLAPDVARTASAPGARPPWFVRPFERTFTPAELWTADFATLIPFPDVEARRRMTRRERLHVGGALAPVIALRAHAAAIDEVDPSRLRPPPTVDAQITPLDPLGPVEPVGSLGPLGPVGLVGPLGPPRELAILPDDLRTDLEGDLAEVLEIAWRAFEKRERDP